MPESGTAKIKHVPLRRCRACRRQAPKSELKRWTLVAGELIIDSEQLLPGRGYYTCCERCDEILPKTLKRTK